MKKLNPFSLIGLLLVLLLTSTRKITRRIFFKEIKEILENYKSDTQEFTVIGIFALISLLLLIAIIYLIIFVFSKINI